MKCYRQTYYEKEMNNGTNLNELYKQIENQTLLKKIKNALMRILPINFKINPKLHIPIILYYMKCQIASKYH